MAVGSIMASYAFNNSSHLIMAARLRVANHDIAWPKVCCIYGQIVGMAIEAMANIALLINKQQWFYSYIRVRAALLKIKSTTYKLFFAIFLTTVLL